LVGFWLRSLESAKTECPFFDWIKEVLPDLSDEIDSCYQLIDSRIKKMRSDLRFQFSITNDENRKIIWQQTATENNNRCE